MTHKNIPYSSLAIIAIGLQLSSLIFVFVCFFTAHQNGWEWTWSVKPENQIILVVLSMIAITQACLSIYFPKLLGNITPQKEKPSSKNNDNFYTKKEKNNLFFDFGTITLHIQNLTIIRLAIAESITIFGVVLVFINHSPLLILPYAIIGFTIQFIVGPFLGKLIK